MHKYKTNYTKFKACIMMQHIIYGSVYVVITKNILGEKYIPISGDCSHLQEGKQGEGMRGVD